MPSRPTPSARARRPLHAVRRPGREPAPARGFPIVGVGASAGGLDAFRQLLAHVPADAGLALVLVQHLEATRASLLSDALAQATAMPVAQAEHGDRVEPNRVYVIPPGTQMAIERGVLQLSPLEERERRPHLPIDFFLQSLAADRGSQSIGVVLSGNASDGTAGLAAIRAQGGITFAQEPGSARFGAMPQSAVSAGVVDFCLPAAELGAQLVRLARHPGLAQREPAAPTLAGAAALSQVLAAVRSATGVDFGEHKAATLKRRLARRMVVRDVRDPAAYLELLRRDPAEVQALFDDLLIKVTSFFRDEEAWDDLRTIAFPEILRHKAPGAPVRAWVVGCATGEEVYSLAMSFLEQAGEGGPRHPLLIFGSDLSERAIEVARAGRYPDAAVRGLGEERLGRFFVRSEGGWRVQQAVREMCVFVRHDVARDPPFARLDLVCCRNVLIYFGQALQRRVLATAHYALQQPGYLLLGRSESAAGGRWFAPARNGSRLFRRRPGASRLHLAVRAGALPASGLAAGRGGRLPADADPTGLVDRLVLARYAPPGVVVDEHLQVVEFRGRTGPYLEAPAGEPQSQLLKMARAGLAAPLRLALAQARRTRAPVRRVGIRVEGSTRGCDLLVLPLPPPLGGGSEPGFAVFFEEGAPPPRSARGRKARPRPAAGARRAIEEELTAARDQVAALLEEHGRGADALATANEELVSGNEELQSLNEELETSKEELQATNEELTTVNDELHGRNLELQLVNADVLNLLEAVELPILILDPERRIRRYTRRAAAFLGLTSADTGKRVDRVALPIRAPDLERWIAQATAEATLVEGDVQDHGDRWHRLQIRPHRTSDGRIDGTILSLVDIDELHGEVDSARWARDYARSIVEAVQVPLLVLDAGLRVLSANGSYYRHFRAQPAETEGHGFFALAAAAWDTAEARRAIATALAAQGSFQELPLEPELPGVGRRAISASGCALLSPAGEPMVLLALDDVSERREQERRRAELLGLAEEAQQRAQRADAAKDLFLAGLSHELRTPLSVMLLQAQILQRGHLDASGVQRAAAVIEANARRQARLVDELLDLSRIATGKLTLAVEEVDWRSLVLGVLEAARPVAEAKGVRLEAEAEGPPVTCRGDPVRLQQVAANLIANAVQFTPGGGRVDVRVDAVDGFARLVVADTGRGIDPGFLSRVFERFTQEEPAVPHGAGIGLGLSIVRDLVALHGGTVRAESPGRGRGSTFTVAIPRSVAAVG